MCLLCLLNEYIIQFDSLFCSCWHIAHCNKSRDYVQEEVVAGGDGSEEKKEEPQEEVTEVSGIVISHSVPTKNNLM